MSWWILMMHALGVGHKFSMLAWVGIFIWNVRKRWQTMTMRVVNISLCKMLCRTQNIMRDSQEMIFYRRYASDIWFQGEHFLLMFFYYLLFIIITQLNGKKAVLIVECETAIFLSFNHLYCWIELFLKNGLPKSSASSKSFFFTW